MQKKQNDTIEFMDGARAVDTPYGGQVMTASANVVYFYYASIDPQPMRFYCRMEMPPGKVINDVRLIIANNEYVLLHFNNYQELLA